MKNCKLDADGFRKEYVDQINEWREQYRKYCFQIGADYVPLDTSMQFDPALTEYLVMRRRIKVKKRLHGIG